MQPSRFLPSHTPFRVLVSLCSYSCSCSYSKNAYPLEGETPSSRLRVEVTAVVCDLYGSPRPPRRVLPGSDTVHDNTVIGSSLVSPHGAEKRTHAPRRARTTDSLVATAHHLHPESARQSLVLQEYKYSLDKQTYLCYTAACTVTTAYHRGPSPRTALGWIVSLTGRSPSRECPTAHAYGTVPHSF